MLQVTPTAARQLQGSVADALCGKRFIVDSWCVCVYGRYEVVHVTLRVAGAGSPCKLGGCMCKRHFLCCYSDISLMSSCADRMMQQGLCTGHVPFLSRKSFCVLQSCCFWLPVKSWSVTGFKLQTLPDQPS